MEISKILLAFLMIVNTLYVLPRIESGWLQRIVSIILIAFVALQVFEYIEYRKNKEGKNGTKKN